MTAENLTQYIRTAIQNQVNGLQMMLPDKVCKQIGGNCLGYLTGENATTKLIDIVACIWRFTS